jgi:hypothetical protein
MHAKWRVALVLLAAGILAGCRPNETVEAQAKDARIKAQIKSKLASDVNASTLTSVEVNVTNGAVTLAGPVHSAEESSRIESTARSVEGVTQVSNNLQILGATATTAPAVTPSAATLLPVTPLAEAPTVPTPTP